MLAYSTSTFCGSLFDILRFNFVFAQSDVSSRLGVFPVYRQPFTDYHKIVYIREVAATRVARIAAGSEAKNPIKETAIATAKKSKKRILIG